MADTPVTIANKALATFGSAPIQSFDDSTPAGCAVALLYPGIMSGLLAEYPWSFCKQTVALVRLNLTELPDGMGPQGWEHAFQMPSTLLANPMKISANNRYPDSPETGYEIQGNIIYSNQVALWALGQFYVDESAWPPYFTVAAVAVLAAELVMPISGNASIKKDLQQDAWGSPQEQRQGGKLGSAKRTDARNNPSRMLAHNPLIDCRGSSIGITSSGSICP